MSEKIIDYKGLFSFRLIRNKRIKKLSIRANTDKGIWLNLPYGISESTAFNFIDTNIDWVLKQKQKIGEKKIFDFDTMFTTKYHSLSIKQDTVNTFIFDFTTNIATVRFPTSLNISDKSVQDFISKSLSRLMKYEANTYLFYRLSSLAKEKNMVFSSLKISNAKTRWGSCSYDNVISLNLQLMRLPDDLIDMIILHELCHTVVKNHSKDFWDLLASVCDNLDAKCKKLNEYSTRDLLK